MAHAVPDVTKVGLALLRDGRLLLVRRHGDSALILPGGKPEAGETDMQALEREIHEELSCRIVRSSVRFVGDFVDELVDDPERTVRIRLYVGSVNGALRPAAEIHEVVWHPLADIDEKTLAPSLRQQILPSLRDRPV
jgi:8-oxo-dGTP diphosphatase